MPPEEPSLRDTLSEAFDRSESPAAETPAAETPAVEPEAPAQEAPELGAEPEAAAPAQERARDAQGRFAKREEAPADPTAPPQPPDAHARPGQAPRAPASSPAAQAYRAPGSWRAEIRGHWDKIHPDAQAEIIRREHETQTVLRESHQARQAVTTLQNVLAPFMANIQAANGGDVVGAIQTVLGADHTLRHGSMHEKCQLAASIIKNFGVDLVMLDGMLSGQVQQQNDPQDALYRRLRSDQQREMAPIVQYFQQQQAREQERAQQLAYEAEQEVNAFASRSGNDHMDDPRVRNLMADMMEYYGRQQEPLTLQEAYDRALQVDPRFRGELQRREEAKRVNAAAAAAQRARRTAVSLPSGAAPSGNPAATASTSLRADLSDAWDAVAGR